ncbi:Spon1, partial [Symbiodinium pilosum]
EDTEGQMRLVSEAMRQLRTMLRESGEELNRETVSRLSTTLREDAIYMALIHSDPSDRAVVRKLIEQAGGVLPLLHRMCSVMVKVHDLMLQRSARNGSGRNEVSIGCILRDIEARFQHEWLPWQQGVLQDHNLDHMLSGSDPRHVLDQLATAYQALRANAFESVESRDTQPAVSEVKRLMRDRGFERCLQSHDELGQFIQSVVREGIQLKLRRFGLGNYLTQPDSAEKLLDDLIQGQARLHELRQAPQAFPWREDLNRREAVPAAGILGDNGMLGDRWHPDERNIPDGRLRCETWLRSDDLQPRAPPVHRPPWQMEEAEIPPPPPPPREVFPQVRAPPPPPVPHHTGGVPVGSESSSFAFRANAAEFVPAGHTGVPASDVVESRQEDDAIRSSDSPPPAEPAPVAATSFAPPPGLLPLSPRQTTEPLPFARPTPPLNSFHAPLSSAARFP